jgi:hypothetical protein
LRGRRPHEQHREDAIVLSAQDNEILTRVGPGKVKGGQVHRELLLLRWDVPDGSPRERANYWYRQYSDNKNFTDKQVTLSETEVSGRKGVVLTMTYRPDGVQLWRKKELYHNAGDQLWKLVVDWAIDTEQDTGGDELFDNAMNTFKTG